MKKDIDMTTEFKNNFDDAKSENEMMILFKQRIIEADTPEKAERTAYQFVEMVKHIVSATSMELLAMIGVEYEDDADCVVSEDTDGPKIIH